MRGPSLNSRLIILSMVSMLIMMVDHRQSHLESIRSALSVVIYPLQYVVDAPVSASRWASDNLSSRQFLLEENARLRLERTQLQAKLQKLSALQVENLRLRELLQSSKKIGIEVLIGELLAVDLEPFTRQIVINKGSNDNVYLGQPLLDAAGIMGQTIHVGPLSSTAMLITDPSHAIPVQVNRNGLRAIVVGTGSPNILEVPYLPNSADIQAGDLLTSSGLGGRFPPDYPVAKVISVYKDPSQSYAVVNAEPTAQLERSREVLLVWTTEHSASQKTRKAKTPGAEETPRIEVAPSTDETTVADKPVAPEETPQDNTNPQTTTEPQ